MSQTLVAADVRPAARRVAAGIAWLVELLAIAAVLLTLQPAFERLAALEAGAERFAAATDAVEAGSAGVVAAEKDAAMRALLRDAGPEWMAAIGLAYACAVLARRRVLSPLAGGAFALVAWSAMAWLGRVPWPLGGALRYARPEVAFAPRAAGFVWALAGLGLGLMLLAALRAAERREGGAAPPSPPLAPGSRVGFAGLALATGVGALLLLDLSVRGAHPNRYLALYHQGHLWLGFTVFSVLLFARDPVARALGWTLAVAGETASALARRFGTPLAVLIVLVLAVCGVTAFGVALANKRQLTSELGRVWIVVGAAWCFYLRGGPLAERLARDPRALRSLVRYAWPMAFVAAVLVGLMVATRDMGPLLIAGYAAGGFVAAAIAGWWHQRSGRIASAFGLAVLLFAAWIGMTTAALFALGAVDPVTAARLESVAAPLASANDQLALVTWFQQAAPPNGFGLGAVPWCGYGASGRCHGVPAQVHSDYTFTALVGAFGTTAAWAAAIGAAGWLHRLVRHHGRVTRGEPRWIAQGGRRVPEVQALLSWIGVAWVVLTSCQLAVTIAGNVAVLPLTGVTFPFVSFGMTSLVLNLAFLALVLHVDVPADAAAHG